MHLYKNENILGAIHKTVDFSLKNASTGYLIFNYSGKFIEAPKRFSCMIEEAAKLSFCSNKNCFKQQIKQILSDQFRQ